MIVEHIQNKQNFNGKIVLKTSINPQQNYLFNLHRPNLEKMIKDLPFDLYVKQSKSKKSIALSTSVNTEQSYLVLKNKQNFEETASLAISDAKEKSQVYKKMVNANKMSECLKNHILMVYLGKFKEAREVKKDLAKLAVEDFDVYKSISNLKITNLPFSVFKTFFVNSMKYKMYTMFTPKSPQEKELIKMNKKYIKELKARNEKIKPIEIQFPNF